MGPAMDYRDFEVKIKIKDHFQEVETQIRLFRDKIYVGYDFGSYNLSLCMYGNGDCTEVVSRGERLLSRIESHDRSHQLVDADSRLGKILNSFRSYFIAGAANGLFGFGITKVERFNDCYFVIESTEHAFFKFQVITNSNMMVVDVLFDANRLESV